MRPFPSALAFALCVLRHMDRRSWQAQDYRGWRFRTPTGDQADSNAPCEPQQVSSEGAIGMSYVCTYQILIVDADDEIDALRQAKACAADERADWIISETTAAEFVNDK